MKKKLDLKKYEKFLKEEYFTYWLALKHHKTHKNKKLDFKNHAYLEAIYLDKSPYIAIIKSTQCFPKDTPVWTDKGAKFIQDICVGDNVLTHKGRYKRVKNTQRKFHKGDLCKIQADNTNWITTTPEHPFYTTEYKTGRYHCKYNKIFKEHPKWKKAIDLMPGDFIYKSKSSIVKNIKYEYNDFKLDKDFGRFIGYYLSEGWCREKGNEIGFAFHCKEKEYIKDLIILLSKYTGNKIRVYTENDNCTRILVCNKRLSKFLTDECGIKSSGKNIPEFAYYNYNIAKGIIIGMMRGDGYLKNSQSTYVTVSKIMAYNFQCLLSLFGIQSAVTIEYPKNKKTAYRVIINGYYTNILYNILGIKKKFNVNQRNQETIWGCASRIRQYSIIEHEGQVYNIEVEDDNSYIANSLIVHNCGITEYLIVRTTGKAIMGKSIFYAMPTYSLVARFVRNRIDKTIGNTFYYKMLEKVAKETADSKRSESMSLKDIGAGNIAFIGSNSTSGFTEFPADEFVVDELDECDQANIEMGWERLSHSEDRTQIKVANPTIESYGIDAEYRDTNQFVWHIKHDCNKWISFDWFKQAAEEVDEGTYIIRDKKWDWNQNRDIDLICEKCGKPINRRQKGLWVPTYQNRLKHGYRISKLFSGTVPLREIMARFNKGLKDNVLLQRVYNADFGMAYTAEGSKITKKMLDGILGIHRNGDISNGFGIIGIDVGSILNVVIGHLLPNMKIKISYIGEIATDIWELEKLIKMYNVRIGVIDALPEQHFVNKVKQRFQWMFSCYYQESKSAPVDNIRNVGVGRTATLDELMEMIIIGNFILPVNAETIPKFYSQMQASTRIYEEMKNVKKIEGAYVWKHSQPDHYHHAMNYLLIARKLLVAINKQK